MATTTQKKVSGKTKDIGLADSIALSKIEDLSDRLKNVEDLADENEGDIVHGKWRIDRLEKFVGLPSLLDEEEEDEPPIKVIKQPCRCGQSGTAPAEIFMWGMMTGVCLVVGILVHQASRSRYFYYGE